MAVHAEQHPLGLDPSGPTAWGPMRLEAPQHLEQHGNLSFSTQRGSYEASTIVSDPFVASVESQHAWQQHHQTPTAALTADDQLQHLAFIKQQHHQQLVNDTNGGGGYLVPQHHAAMNGHYRGEHDRQFKTRLCVYLASGTCPHGSRCLFAHSTEELRAAPSHRSNCGTEYKTKLCRYSFADCPFAAVGRCQFAHSVEELRAPAGGVHGASSRRFKTRLCKYHMAGHCPYAATNTCQFAHSEEELRSPPATLSTNGRRATGPVEWYAAASNSTELSPPTPAGTDAAPTINGSHRVVVATNQARQPQDVSAQSPGGAGQSQSAAALRAALEQKRFTKLCKYFLAGHCPFAASGTCQFAHSATELRRRSPPPQQPPAPQQQQPRSPRKSSRSPQRAPRLVVASPGPRQNVVPAEQPSVAPLQVPPERPSTTPPASTTPLVQSIEDIWSSPGFALDAPARVPDWSFHAEVSPR